MYIVMTEENSHMALPTNFVIFLVNSLGYIFQAHSAD